MLIKIAGLLTRLFSPNTFLGKTATVVRAIPEYVYLLLKLPFKEWLQFVRFSLKVLPRYTMVLPRRLYNLYFLMQKLAAQKTAGDYVECGVWNGGSAAIAAS